MSPGTSGPAGAAPDSSRRTPTTSPRRSTAAAVLARMSPAAFRWCSGRSGASLSAPADSAMRLRSWPSTSCMSWAIRARSRDRARSAISSCSRRSCSACSHPARTSCWYWDQNRPANQGSIVPATTTPTNRPASGSQAGTADRATTPAASTATRTSAVGAVRPARRPVRNAATAAGTTHHRLTTLNRAPAAEAPASTAPAAGRDLVPFTTSSTPTTLRTPFRAPPLPKVKGRHGRRSRCGRPGRRLPGGRPCRAPAGPPRPPAPRRSPPGRRRPGPPCGRRS